MGTPKYNTLLSRKFHAYKHTWSVEESIPKKSKKRVTETVVQHLNSTKKLNWTAAQAKWDIMEYG